MNFLTSLRTLLLAIILSIGISYTYAAWSPPSVAPTGGNAEAPVNVGGATQVKAGALTVVGLFQALSNVVLAVNLGTNVGVGDATPDGSLKFDVEGSVGATQYCDKDGNNCITNMGGGIRFPDNTTQVTAFTGSGSSPSCVVQYVGVCTDSQTVDYALPGYTDSQCEWVGKPGEVHDGWCAYCGYGAPDTSNEYLQSRDLGNVGCATKVAQTYMRCCNYNIQ